MVNAIKLGTVAAIFVAALMLSVPLAIILQSEDEIDRETLYQFNTLDAFLDGSYDGVMPYSEIFLRGDTGLGTFHAVDGEMIAFDGRYYQIKWDGTIVNVTGDMTAPLVMVTWFDTDAEQDFSGMNMSVFRSSLDTMRCSDNYIYVFVAKGELSMVKTRSFAPQETPYKPLANVSAINFESQDVNGTLVIMWFPGSFSTLNLDDYHMHFLADDYSIGGHVTDLHITSVNVAMDMTPGYQIELPLTDQYREWDAQGSDVAIER